MVLVDEVEDYYAILEVPLNATQDDITKAYRRLVRVHHPDKNPQSANATAITQKLNTAHRVLGDFNKRKAYDLKWPEIKRNRGRVPTPPAELSSQDAWDDERRATNKALKAWERTKMSFEVQISNMQMSLRVTQGELDHLTAEDNQLRLWQRQNGTLVRPPDPQFLDDVQDQKWSAMCYRKSRRTIKQKEILDGEFQLRALEIRLAQCKASIANVELERATEDPSVENGFQARELSREKEIRNERAARRKATKPTEYRAGNRSWDVKVEEHSRWEQDQLLKAKDQAAKRKKQKEEMTKAKKRDKTNVTRTVGDDDAPSWFSGASTASTAHISIPTPEATPVFHFSPHREYVEDSESRCLHSWSETKDLTLMCEFCDKSQQRIVYQCLLCLMLVCHNCRFDPQKYGKSFSEFYRNGSARSQFRTDMGGPTSET